MPASRTSRLSVRASPAELTLWSHIARSHGHVTTSDWIRSLLTSAEFSGDDGPSISDELRRLRTQLSRVGNNLNQLAHSANCGDAVHCRSVLGDIETLIHRLDRILSRSRKKPSRRIARRTCDTTVTLH
ncbi:MobC family plasmid mobilization relaxosome protein [Acetobacter farinalis]|uniref:MobC family plasmid mobilization relaxosome protein n=1 Tax=Acetobacter farinalis TaxID=1260984 RepID=A0ABT3Q9U2_9PROT|nr:MobC family plasmid mobilization relaxosome protein [Acetobacter farinalis]MCX2562020.1 MobC family plasmid mobilization relaxosome protein [Acetobacter farinalis]NHO30657.1 plasmid mobilization relaxosome protein MobC [Acetobacter farinalis]